MNWLRRMFGLHIHEWGKWKPILGGLWQRKTCKTCGLSRDKYI